MFLTSSGRPMSFCDDQSFETDSYCVFMVEVVIP